MRIYAKLAVSLSSSCCVELLSRLEMSSVSSFFDLLTCPTASIASSDH